MRPGDVAVAVPAVIADAVLATDREADSAGEEGRGPSEPVTSYPDSLAAAPCTVA
jgi:hypothetical protein